MEKRREKKKKIFGQMIGIYCRKVHHTKEGLCPECEAVRAYADARSERCPFVNEFLYCSSCRVHCYTGEKREQIRRIMRFAGPRMLLYHPIPALEHVVEVAQHRKKNEKHR